MVPMLNYYISDFLANSVNKETFIINLRADMESISQSHLKQDITFPDVRFEITWFKV